MYRGQMSCHGKASKGSGACLNQQSRVSCTIVHIVKSRREKSHHRMVICLTIDAFALEEP